MSNVPIKCLCGHPVRAPYFCYRCQISYGSLSCEACSRPIRGARVWNCPECEPQNTVRHADTIATEVLNYMAKGGAVERPMPTKGTRPCGHPNGERDIWCGPCQRNHCAACVDRCRERLTRAVSGNGSTTTSTQREFDFGLAQRKRKAKKAKQYANEREFLDSFQRAPAGFVELTEYVGEKAETQRINVT